MDFKKFKSGDCEFGVGQISSMSADELNGAKVKLMDAVEEFQKAQGSEMIFFMLTNILDTSSEVIYCGENSGRLIRIAFNLAEQSENDVLGSIDLPGVISRKKQMIPKLMEAFRNL